MRIFKIQEKIQNLDVFWKMYGKISVWGPKFDKKTSNDWCGPPKSSDPGNQVSKDVPRVNNNVSKINRLSMGQILDTERPRSVNNQYLSVKGACVCVCVCVCVCQWGCAIKCHSISCPTWSTKAKLTWVTSACSVLLWSIKSLARMNLVPQTEN